MKVIERKQKFSINRKKSLESKKLPKKDSEKEAFLYTSQKNAAKLFAKYL